jgi:hypothetical protein
VKCKTSKHSGDFQLDFVVLSTFPKDPVSFSEGSEKDPTKPPTFMNLKFADSIKFREKKTEPIRDTTPVVVKTQTPVEIIKVVDGEKKDPVIVDKGIPKNGIQNPSVDDKDPIVKVSVQRRQAVRESLEGFASKNDMKEFVFHVVEIGGTEYLQAFVGGVINIIAAYLEEEKRGHIVDEVTVKDGPVMTKVCNNKVSFVKSRFDTIRQYDESRLMEEIKNKSITLFVVNAQQFKTDVEEKSELINYLSSMTTHMLKLASTNQMNSCGYSSSFVITTCEEHTDKTYKTDLKSTSTLHSRMIRLRDGDEGDISVILDDVVSYCSKIFR